MKGLLFALQLSVNGSFRGLRRWSEAFRACLNGTGFPPPGFAIAGLEPQSFPFPSVAPEGSEANLEDKKSEGFLWGVPKRRRSVEKRLTRKHGIKEWHHKLIVPKYNLLICENCGHHYQAKHLCRNCYEKTVEETKSIREAIEAKLGDSPVDKDVIVLYESDKAKGVDASSINANNKLIIEIPKERPTFFSSNLLQKSTAGSNKQVKDVTAQDAVPIVHKDK